MAVSSEDIKKLREMTSCGVIECKKALESSNGDFEKAKKVLMDRGLEIAAKKSGRQAKEGRIETYIHPGNKLAVILEISCETDFVAKSENFIALTKNIAMHIAAFNPKYINREDVPEAEVKAAANAEQYYKEVCLLDQPFVKDPSKSVKDCVTNLIASIGENIFIHRYVRYKIGE
ncbi:MAG: translation elongation factor Ts [Candidatus Omnitrophica bacterium]|nr:translation elongation factor Ts [Candidatus Omnitrophota bacterium]